MKVVDEYDRASQPNRSGENKRKKLKLFSSSEEEDDSNLYKLISSTCPKL